MPKAGAHSLQVIGAGFGRTGTTSLQAALETLGFRPCYKTMFTRIWDSWKWERALKGELDDWDRIFRSYRSTVDWPSCAFYDKIAAAYPQAKVILTVRDPERWYDSMMKTVYRGHKWIASPAFNLTRPIRAWHHAGRVQEAIIWQHTFGGQFEDRERTIAVFKQHIEEVKSRIPPERLLVYELKQGWEPLCSFLGVPVPKDTPFPHLNDASAFQKIVGGRTVAFLGSLAVVGAIAALAIARRRHAD